MNKSLPILTLWVFVAVALFAAAYGALVVQAQHAGKAVPEAAAYEAVLGKSLNDQAVADFIAVNRCSGTGPFQTCNAAGLALLIGQGQKVETVYLYPNKIDDFAVYRGKLPLGLSASDTMASVEEKFGLPEQGGTPDRAHYWAIYRRFGLTIVYNSPSATDKRATIHAILVSQ